MAVKLELELEDLQEQHKQYAEIIGIDNLIALSKEYGGTQIYIPQISELHKLKKYKSISDEFNGTNVSELAKKYQISESTVYRVVRDKLVRMERQQLEGQMNILDILGSQ